VLKISISWPFIATQLFTWMSFITLLFQPAEKLVWLVELWWHGAALDETVFYG